VAGTDECTVSRPTISNIRDAWVEMYTEMVYRNANVSVAAHFASGVSPKSVFIVHVQDEADIKLRSGDARDGPSMPRRGRASKVQAHVVTVVVGQSRHDIPTELEALGDKTAPTLATSLEAVLRKIVSGVLPERSAHVNGAAHGNGTREEQHAAHGNGAQERRSGAAHDDGGREHPETWVVHILIGDGVPTNLAAAKLLWASVAHVPLGKRVRYFIAVVKCATHQAALTAKAAVTGTFAATAGGELYKTTAGVAVRLFKYLINDYYEDFCTTAWDWVSNKLRVVAHGGGERDRHTATTRGLRELYTSHVIGDEMMLLWNNGFGLLSHEVGAGVDPTDARLALVGRFARFMIEELLKVDSHPTVTSFFTFARNCAPHAHHALHRYASSRAPRDVHASGPRQRGHCRSHRLVTAPRPRAGLQVTIPLCLCELRGLRAGGQWLLLTGVISGPRARRHWHRLIGILRWSDSRPIQRRAAPVVGWITSFASHES
ncbi:MAG: hypothetical protein VX863_01705, partial [Candidatus Thermoplasmatota archaeon]|nr:hypothetical protein [Candidatus Thermoplasmatota archaeon]